MTKQKNRLYYRLKKLLQEKYPTHSSNYSLLLNDLPVISQYCKDTFPEYRRLSNGALQTNIKTLLLCMKKETDDLLSKSDSDTSSFEINDEMKMMEITDSNLLNKSLRHHYSKENEPKKRKIGGDQVHTNPKSTSNIPPDVAALETRQSHYSYLDIGGINEILQDIRELIEFPLLHPEIYHHLGVDPPTGILLHGPPGCGKTLLANAIAGEVKVKFFKIAAPEIVSGMSGESEAKIRKYFDDAIEHAPSLLFFDEIDSITPKRETASREMERRIVAQLLICMDSLIEARAPVIVLGATNRPDALEPALRRAGRFDREISLGIPTKLQRRHILEILARKLRVSDDVDFKILAHMTPGYVGADLSALTKEAAVHAIHRIFQKLTPNTMSLNEKELAAPGISGIPGVSPEKDLEMKTEESIEKEEVVMKTKDSIEKDLEMKTEESIEKQEVVMKTKDSIEKELERKTEDSILKKVPFENATSTEMTLVQRENVSKLLKNTVEPVSDEILQTLFISMDDFTYAYKNVQPSAKREGFTTIPNVKWEHIGGLGTIIEELERVIVFPVKNPDMFEAMGILSPSGVLLFGPPGCGKTLVAKAVAQECGANFISVKGPQILSKYVGESERAVRQLFQRAQASAPCVVFFDELDAICTKRNNEDNQSSQRVVNQLLTEMDGLEKRRDVFVIGASNRPDVIDPAMLRPGRLDKLLAVDLPTPEGRRQILEAVARLQNTPLDSNVDFQKVANDPRCEGFSGADLAALMKEASLNALQETVWQPNTEIQTRSFATKTVENGDGVRVPFVMMHDFECAFSKVKRSVSKRELMKYQNLKNSLHHCGL